ncbi:DEAD-box ATP-dependent RNA helicase 7-like isoform X1 [Coffea arabica]|uniref:RNA helicase n=1 Tax=Coffea arabica TaxID=13443 RepID=A0A6P6VLM5_COFAR
MPSLAVSGNCSLETSKDRKKKKVKNAEAEAQKSPELDSSMEQKFKKEKKSKKTKISNSDSDSEELKKKKKKEKKRKAAEIDGDNVNEEERSDTSSELGEPMNLMKKKAKLTEVDEDDEEKSVKEEHPNALTKFRISERLREALKVKGIEYLFPIQAMTFDTILDGSDLVGRARTGQGKTLAFVLPILESLTNGPAKAARKTGYGRAPSVLVLLPTRELACQVFTDFEVYGGALGLTSCCIYGQSPYRQQEIQLKRGVDIVIGTTGRVKDHIERENINFSSLRFRVLDEADEMLKMGFVDDVEFILGKVESASEVQTLLFSATLPDWVKQIAAKFLKPDKKTADLIGNEKMKASASVRHIVLPCSTSARAQLIPDIIHCYSRGGQTIIFTETKDSASELAGLLPGARALHGDIQQSQREVTLSGFRSGKFTTLVATNVAARGLDIDNVQLIIQCEPPRDVEAYIHRSGRTGRAGNTGVAVMLYDPRRSNISKIERECGVKFEHVSAPQPADIAEAAGAEAAEKISQISDSVIPAFKAAAEELLNNSNLSPVELLAKALAKAAGYSEIKSRSILTSMENHVTLLLECGRPIYTPSFAYSVLRRFLPEEKVESIKGLALTADGKGAVFDVAAEDLDFFVKGQEGAGGVSLDVVKLLPRLQDRDQVRGGRFGSGGRGGFSDRRGGGNRFSGGRGGRGGSSDRRNGQFSKSPSGGGGFRNNNRKW